jgi:tetratricopeptide (TPR) repeat protein
MTPSGFRRPLVVCLALIILVAGAAAALGLTALESAVHKGDVKKVKELLDKGANVNEFKYGTALMIAAQDGRLEIARLLIDRGADINVQSNMGWTALGLAADGGHTDMVDLLITKGADVDASIAAIKKWAEWTAGPPVSSPSKAQQILKAIGVVESRAGFAYYSAGQYDKAIAVFQSRMRDNPQDVQNYLGVAFSSVALKKYDDAKAAAEGAIKIAPDNADAYLGLADALMGKDDSASAVDPLKKGIALSPKNPWAYNRLGLAYYNLHDYPDAIVNFRKASELAPNELSPIQNLSNTYGRAGDLDDAIAMASRLVEKMPPRDSVDVLGFRSFLYREKGLFAQAASDAEKAVSIDPGKDWSRTAAGIEAFDKGNFDEAIRQISGVKDKDFVLAFIIEATAYAKKGDMARAEQVYGSVGAEAASSTNALVVRNARILADLLRPTMEGHFEKAKSLEGGPNYREAVAEYALALKTADEGAAKAIRTHVAALIKAHPDVGELPEDARKYVMRGEVLVDEKHPGDAIQQYAAAARLAPFYPQDYYNMAVLSANLGKFKEAVSLMHAFLDLSPDAKNAREATDLTYKWEFMLEQASGKK